MFGKATIPTDAYSEIFKYLSKKDLKNLTLCHSFFKNNTALCHQLLKLLRQEIEEQSIVEFYLYDKECIILKKNGETWSLKEEPFAFKRIPEMNNVIQVYFEHHNILFLKSDGTLWEKLDSHAYNELPIDNITCILGTCFYDGTSGLVLQTKENDFITLENNKVNPFIFLQNMKLFFYECEFPSVVYLTKNNKLCKNIDFYEKNVFEFQFPVSIKQMALNSNRDVLFLDEDGCVWIQEKNILASKKNLSDPIKTDIDNIEKIFYYKIFIFHQMSYRSITLFITKNGNVLLDSPFIKDREGIEVDANEKDPAIKDYCLSKLIPVPIPENRSVTNISFHSFIGTNMDTDLNQQHYFGHAAYQSYYNYYLYFTIDNINVLKICFNDDKHKAFVNKGYFEPMAWIEVFNSPQINTLRTVETKLINHLATLPKPGSKRAREDDGANTVQPSKVAKPGG